MGETVTITSGAASTLPPGTKIAVDDAGADGVVQLVGLVAVTDGAATKIDPATAGNQDAQTALLTTMDADTSSLAGAVKTTDAAAGGSDLGIPAMYIRDDTLTTLGISDGDYGPARMNSRGAPWMAMDTRLDGTNDAVALEPRSGLGALTGHNVNAGTAVSTIKNAAGTLLGYTFANLHTTDFRFVKLYDASSPTVGGGTPKKTIPIPPLSTGHISFGYGVAFGTAIKYIVTTGVADNNTGAPGSNEVVFEPDYI